MAPPAGRPTGCAGWVGDTEVCLGTLLGAGAGGELRMDRGDVSALCGYSVGCTA